METTTTRKRGRPRNNDRAPTWLQVRVTALRQWRLTLQHALKLAKTAKARAPIVDALADISERLGPAVDPAWRPDPGAVQARTAGYECLAADGTTTVLPTLAEAAEWYGVRKTSLSAMLGRGGGVVRRRAMLADGGLSVVTVKRVGMVPASNAKPVPLEISKPKNATGRENEDAPTSRTKTTMAAL